MLALFVVLLEPTDVVDMECVDLSEERKPFFGLRNGLLHGGRTADWLCSGQLIAQPSGLLRLLALVLATLGLILALTLVLAGISRILLL